MPKFYVYVKKKSKKVDCRIFDTRKSRLSKDTISRLVDSRLIQQ